MAVLPFRTGGDTVMKGLTMSRKSEKVEDERFRVFLEGNKKEQEDHRRLKEYLEPDL